MDKVPWQLGLRLERSTVVDAILRVIDDGHDILDKRQRLNLVSNVCESRSDDFIRFVLDELVILPLTLPS